MFIIKNPSTFVYLCSQSCHTIQKSGEKLLYNEYLYIPYNSSSDTLARYLVSSRMLYLSEEVFPTLLNHDMFVTSDVSGCM